MWEQIVEKINETAVKEFQIEHRRSVEGGSVNQAYVLTDNSCSYFVKINKVSCLEMFVTEALGLKQIFESKTIRVPQPVCWGTAGDAAYIVLEWLDLGNGDRHAWEAMGRNLAAMHQVITNKGFGWERNNTIGFIPQLNDWTENWTEFFIEYRLGYQFRSANQRGGRFPQQDRLLAKVPKILAGYNPQPSLIHGDLWTGNAAITVQGEAVIFDPAIYFGDREVDLAMSQLFGSFPPNFYSAYNEVLPLEAGYKTRKILYNLYHILNHFNQFGGSYEYQANQMINSLL